MRATELPFNQRINVPKHAGDGMEVKMYNLKGELRKIPEKVASEITDADNLSKQQQRGIKTLAKRVKHNDLVVVQTDKSGQFSIDFPANY